jgi:hypothetical protein
VKPDAIEELDTTEDQLKIVVGAKVGIGVGLPDKYVGDIVGIGVGLPGKYVGLKLGTDVGLEYVTYKLVLVVVLDEIAIYPLSLIDNT